MATPVPSIHFEKYVTNHKRATTTATTTVSFCTSVTGCGATDITSTSSEITEETPQPHVILPRDPFNLGDLRLVINQQALDVYESHANGLGTVFFFVPSYTLEQTEYIRQYDEALSAYIPRGPLTAEYWRRVDAERNANANVQHKGKSLFPNSTDTPFRVRKRAEIVQPYSDRARAEMVLLSWPPGSGHVPYTGGSYKYDGSAGHGTFLYGCDSGIVTSHEEFADLTITPLFPGPFPVGAIQDNHPHFHGTKCMAKAVGKYVGIARRAQAIQTVWNYHQGIQDTWIDALVKIYDDIRSKGRGTKSVVNLSISFHVRLLQDTPGFIDRFGMHSTWWHTRFHTLILSLTSHIFSLRPSGPDSLRDCGRHRRR